MSRQSWNVRTLAGSLFLGAVLMAGVAENNVFAGGKPAAVVNEIAIPFADFETMMKLAGMNDPMAVEVPNDRKKMMQMQVLGSMIDEILIQQFLNKNAPPVPAVEVEKKFNEMKDNLAKQGKTIADFCKESGNNESSIRKDIASHLQWANYGASRITEADLQKYYKENKEFFDGTTVRCSHIVVRMPFNAPESEKASLTAKLNALRQQLVEGKVDFAEAARTYSHCPSAKQGGDLNYIPRKGLVDEEFSRVAFAMQVGQVSGVVQTDFGLHLIRVTDRKEGKPSDYEKLKPDIHQMVMGELWNNILMQQRKAAKIEINVP